MNTLIHLPEALMWSWTTLVCLLIGWNCHMLMKIHQWRELHPDVTVTVWSYSKADWPTTILSALLSIGLYLSLPELGKFLGFTGLGMTPLTSLLVGYFSDSIADAAGKRATAALGLNK